MQMDTTASQRDIQQIHDRLYHFNCQQTGVAVQEIVLEPNPNRFALTVKDGERLCGGLVYTLTPERRSMYIDYLWVSDELRGQGYGVKLLEAACAAAETAQYELVRLFTCDFQAPGFYPKYGFELEKVTEKDGHKQYHYQRRLSGAPPSGTANV